MKAEIEALKAQYMQAETEADFDAVRAKMRVLCDEDAAAVAAASLASIRETNAELLRDKLKNILPIVSVSYLAKTYFRRSPQWFYQRLNGNAVNGKRAQFTDDELKTLQSALRDISGKIDASASVVF